MPAKNNYTSATAQDYYPFGMLMPGRNYNASAYKFGYQRQEIDNEIKGDGNSINFKFRVYDSRLARFLSVDPLITKYPHYSPYSFSGNKVINSVELEGLEEANIVYNLYYESHKAGHITSGDIKKNLIGAAAILMTPVAIYGGGAIIASEISLWSGSGFALSQTPAIRTYLRGAIKASTTLRILSFGADAGGQFGANIANNYSTIKRYDIGGAFNDINWTSPTLNAVNPTAFLFNGFFASYYQVYNKKSKIGTAREIAVGTLAEAGFGKFSVNIDKLIGNQIKIELSKISLIGTKNVSEISLIKQNRIMLQAMQKVLDPSLQYTKSTLTNMDKETQNNTTNNSGNQSNNSESGDNSNGD